MAQYINGADLTNWDGWINLPLTPVYGSATTFTYPADLTGFITAGDKIRVTNNGSVKYFYVLPPVTFSSGNTTVTVTGGSDYSLVNSGSPVMASLSYSKMASPYGFPQWFTLATSNYSGFSAVPTTTSPRFAINGRVMTVVLANTGSGTSNSTSFTLTLPCNAAQESSGLGESFDNGAWAGAGYVSVASGSNAATFNKSTPGTNASWTASGAKAWYGTFNVVI